MTAPPGCSARAMPTRPSHGIRSTSVDGIPARHRRDGGRVVQVVSIEERDAQAFGERRTDGRLADGRYAHDHDPRGCGLLERRLWRGAHPSTVSLPEIDSAPRRKAVLRGGDARIRHTDRMRTRILALAAAAVFASFALAGCSAGDDGEVIAPVVMSAEELQGESVELIVGQALDITTGDLAEDSYSGEVADSSIVTFEKGGERDGATFNPGLMAKGRRDRGHADERAGRHSARRVHRHGRRKGIGTQTVP